MCNQKKGFEAECCLEDWRVDKVEAITIQGTNLTFHLEDTKGILGVILIEHNLLGAWI